MSLIIGDHSRENDFSADPQNEGTPTVGSNLKQLIQSRKARITATECSMWLRLSNS